MSAFEERLARVEVEVAEARKDAAAARVLAGGADREVSAMRVELRAHTKSLHALRETQVEQGQQIAELRSEMRDGFAKARSELQGLDAEMRDGFTKLNHGQVRITALLTAHLGASGDSAG